MLLQAMDRETLIEQLDEILALLSRQTNGAKGGISEQRRQTIERLVKIIRDDVLNSTD